VTADDAPGPRPVGAPLDWAGAARPRRRTLQGVAASLEPLDVPRHARDLYEASHPPVTGPELWDYLPYGPFADLREFTAWLAACERSPDPLWFAIVNRDSGRALGMASYLRIAPAHGVIEIGHIWMSPLLQRTRAATEAIYLLAREVFAQLGDRRLEWKCDALNAPSRRAAERFGFRFEGVFRQAAVIKGRNRDTAWYSLLDGEWPAARDAWEQWLDESNFDAAGRQRRALGEIHASLGAPATSGASARRAP
jgi:RimJ/RimL family protein N-acetyltransferase